MQSGNVLSIAIVEHDHDYSNVAPDNEDLKTGFWFADEEGTSKDPYIDYTLATGYTHNVMGVAAANIAKVNGVATANIDKINGVD